MAHLHPEDRDSYRRVMDSLRPGQPFRLEFRTGGAKNYRWLELRATIVTDRDVPSDCLGLLADITDRKEGPPPTHDKLTGLRSRANLEGALQVAKLKTATLALLDLDRFKQIHASLGDAGGDIVLLQTARRLNQRFGKEAQIFRTGGDGFALLFAGTTPAPQALGDDLVELCNPSHPIDGRNIFAPVSAGIASGGATDNARDGVRDGAALMRQAERALGAAKRRGGACAKVYHEGMEVDAPGDSVALEADLRHALDEGQIDNFYQPIMRLADRSVAGFEALLRWHHPEKGLIAPGDFIPHSEESGLIVTLGRFALERAANDLSQWQRYFPVTPALFVSVNLSRRQLRDRDFEALLARVLTASRIAPLSLKLEVTESAIGTDEELSQMLSRIRAAGAGLSIDDFGTGTSTLSQFRSLPFDTVKIDKSFLAHLPGGAKDSEVVLTSIIALAHDLKRAVVVEGVENAEDAQLLERLGCEYGQGYYFSAPLTTAEALAFIARYYDVNAAAPLS
jgi:diguanylate cyclase (GGDEF)-like protein